MPASRALSTPPRTISLRQTLREEIPGKGQKVQREERPPSHRIHVGKGVGGGDPPEIVRVVHDRREEVEGDDQRAPVGNMIHGGVVPLAGVNQNPRVVGGNHVTQHLRQLGLAELARSAGAVRQGAEPYPPSLIAVLTGHGENVREWCRGGGFTSADAVPILMA